MRPISDLEDFVANRMQISEVYQPVVIRALITRGGRATLTEMADDLARWKPSSLEELRKRLLQSPRSVLEGHGIIEHDPDSDTFVLQFDPGDTEAATRIATLCEQRIEEWLERRAEPESPWEEFTYWARKFFEAPRFEENEVVYKAEIGEHVRAAAQAIRTGAPDWHHTLRSAFGPPNNLTYFINHSRFLDWANEQPNEAQTAMLGLWDESGDLGHRVDAFAAALPENLASLSAQLELASFLLLADPNNYAMYRATPMKTAARLAGYEEFPKGPPSAVYLHALSFLDTFIDEARQRDLQLRDRLDAQGLVWAISKATKEDAFVLGDEFDAFMQWRGEKNAVWWVNQGTTFDRERAGGYVWAPQRTKKGAVLAHWLSVSKLQVDDVIVHYANGAVRSIGRVARKPKEAAKPAEHESELWEASGYYCAVEYFDLDSPISLADIPVKLRQEEGPAFNKAGGVNQAYMHRLSPGFATALREQFQDRWPAASPWGDIEHEDETGRHYWIFQANPKVYDFVADLGNLQIGHEYDWTVSRYLERYAPGDRVAIWVAGPNAALWALGEITGEVYERPPGERFGGGDPSVPEKATRWTLQQVVDPPLSRDVLKDHPILKDLQIIKAPQGTNFEVTREQWQEIIALIRQRTPLSLSEIHERLTQRGFRISLPTLRRYHHSLNTRGFVILSGLSGTGKTWLAELYAEAIGARFKLIPVAPNWTTNEDLLGYFNPLDRKYYDTDFSLFLREAAAEWEQAQDQNREPQSFHVLLDEMNLARVEYYFAKFLSVMELVARQGAAAITAGPEDEIVVYRNLSFVGTVNVDETTHGFADKVYDRAQLVELGIDRGALAEHLGNTDYAEAVLRVWDAVAPVKPFAYRVADEIRRYADGATSEDASLDEALDDQILQKILPKLSGADGKLGTALEALIELAAGRYPQTEKKARRMLDDLKTHGFTSYF
ncbi:MAG: EVE domain-containing protein [Spirochaetales bacterium]|nr:EVE domain-containing protein [Spirochaetales bacterium]